MKMYIFSFFDSKSAAFMQPFFCQTSDVAIRATVDISLDGKEVICRHAGDFSLMEIGSFDPQTGRLKPHSAAINHGTCLQIRARAQQLAVEKQPELALDPIRQAFMDVANGRDPDSVMEREVVS